MEGEWRRPRAISVKGRRRNSCRLWGENKIVDPSKLVKENLIEDQDTINGDKFPVQTGRRIKCSALRRF